MGRTISSDEQKELDFIQAYKVLCTEHKMYVAGDYRAPATHVRRLGNTRERLNLRHQIVIFKDDAIDY